MKKGWVILLCLLLLPACSLAAVPESVLHEAILTLAWPDAGGEYWVEGHVVLGEAQQGDTTRVYAEVFYQNYGFMDGVFTDTGGGGMGPVTLVFDTDGYALREIIRPEDGTEYLPSLRTMMPADCIRKMEQNADENRAEMERQMTEQAQVYLLGIERSEPVQDWRERDLQTADMLVCAGNMVISLSPPYPLWVTTTERIENGVRYLYSREWLPDEHSPDGYTYVTADGQKHQTDGRTGTQILRKVHRSSGKTVETILIQAEPYALTVTYADAYGEISYRMAYDGRTYHRPEVRSTGKCRVSHPEFERQMNSLLE